MHPVPPIVVLAYRVRLPGMLFIAVFAVAHFGGRRQSPLLVAAMVLTALWPHAAYLLAKNAKDTKQAELRNLLFDSFIVGCWMVAMSFSLWPPGARAATIMNGNLSVGGLRFAGKGVLAILAGVLVTGAFLGFHPVFASNVATTALCIAATLILTSMFGIHSHLQTARVYKAKNDLAIQNQQIQEQNRLIEQARPAQERVPRQHEPRAAHAAERDHRLQRDAGGGRARLRQRGLRGGSAEDPVGGKASPGPHQRRARSLQGRGRQDEAVPRDFRGRRRGRGGRGHGAAPGGEERQHAS